MNSVCASLLLFFCGQLFGSSASYTIPKGVLFGDGLSTELVATFALFVALLLFLTIACGRILKVLLYCPVIAGQIIGGVLIGPSCLNILGWKIFNHPVMAYDAAGNIYTIASSDLFLFFILLCSSALTVTYLLWAAGHETDVKELSHVGVTALTAGVLGALLPIGMTVSVAYYFIYGFSLVESIGLGLILSATSVSIPVTMLVAKRKMHLKSSKATLGAAIIDDIFSVLLLSMFFIALQAGMFGSFSGLLHEANATFVESLVYMIVSFAVIFFTGYFIIPPVLGWLKKHHSSFLVASFASGAMLLYFAFAELVGGLAGITGAFFAGLFHRIGDNRHQAEKVISPFVRSFLLPLFLGSIGLQVNISLLSLYQWAVVFMLLVVAIISKILACYISTFLSNWARHGTRKPHWSALEGYLFGSSMVARGEVGLVIATILRGSQVISSDQYVISVVVIVLTTIAAPLMLAVGFHRLELIPEKEGYSLNLGLFKVIGTNQMFNIIMGRIEAMGKHKTSINMSEGRKIAEIDGHRVKIIYDPEEGITFRGKRKKVEQILHEVRTAVARELESVPEIKEMED